MANEVRRLTRKMHLSPREQAQLHDHLRALDALLLHLQTTTDRVSINIRTLNVPISLRFAPTPQ
jgi:hypothetical protein